VTSDGAGVGPADATSAHGTPGGGQAAGDFFVRFWGVRGSIACPGHAYERYGGNTSCLEVRCGPHVLIFDCGTGLRPLGKHLMTEAQGEDGPGTAGAEIDIFLTHTHHDHIAGIPFFAPAFCAASKVRFWAGHLKPEDSLHEVLCKFMAAPLFPVPPAIFGAQVEYLDFRAGETLEPHEGVVLKTAPLNHPNRATGYRVEYGERAICYVTDTEHVQGERDPNVVELIRDADIVVYDCSYTDEEYPKFAGWGHSTWQEGVRLVEAAGAERLAIFHHDPAHDDAFMDRVAAEAEARRPGTVVAQEGMVLAP
jgi:phosphoribosyl 1,2-cyclic phosphodiesterase